MIIYIESALAFINLVDICKTARQLSKRFSFEPVALVLGSDDLLANLGKIYEGIIETMNYINKYFLGATRTEDSKEILYARQKLVLTAKAFELQAIDLVYINYKGNLKYCTVTVCKNSVLTRSRWFKKAV